MIMIIIVNINILVCNNTNPNNSCCIRPRGLHEAGDLVPRVLVRRPENIHMGISESYICFMGLIVHNGASFRKLYLRYIFRKTFTWGFDYNFTS